ncbi:hypothetical protein [Actinobacillus pleuropneumoniae]|uniref:hypothetical protein n=1 Tax=Actinobacillus pleuropneumoniae TaxID=715 RepID=UPI00201CE725|nr:hypothetical protein [Actinobacillus pleuropneumoniae]UQZ26739.1 hypothetical protein M6G44_10715 [Actinobacillus pleuropneumoniae]
MAIYLALFVGKGINGWQWTQQSELIALRLPRLMAAIAVGILLSVAGVIFTAFNVKPDGESRIIGSVFRHFDGYFSCVILIWCTTNRMVFGWQEFSVLVPHYWY